MKAKPKMSSKSFLPTFLSERHNLTVLAAHLRCGCCHLERGLAEPSPHIEAIPEWRERLIDYFYKAESQAETIDDRDRYKFCRRLVNLAFDGWPDPWVS